MNIQTIVISLLIITMAVACTENNSMNDNPFAQPSTLPFEAPDFTQIDDEHFYPAFISGMERQIEEIEQIASNPEEPTFENTIVAMEDSGELLTRVQRVFFNLTSAHTNKKNTGNSVKNCPEISLTFR